MCTVERTALPDEIQPYSYRFLFELVEIHIKRTICQLQEVLATTQLTSSSVSVQIKHIYPKWLLPSLTESTRMPCSCLLS